MATLGGMTESSWSDPRDASVGKRVRHSARFACILWAILFLLSFGTVEAQDLGEPEVELQDVVAVELVGRDLYAYDLLGTGTAEIRLEIGEELISAQARGQLAVALTDRRLLAVRGGTSLWQEVRWRVHESRPQRARLGKRVAVVATDKRLLGFDSGSGQWLSIDLGPNEELRETRVGAQTAVLLTDRKAYGLSPERGGFVGIPISIQEKVRSVSAGANSATVSTSWRYLVFRAPAGTWTESRRKLN